MVAIQKEIIKPDFISGESETSMSIVIDHRRPGSLRQAVDWLREARAALTHPATRVSGMSDKDLRRYRRFGRGR